MGILTFKGGVHPYDGKELSKNSPVVKYLPKGDMVYPLSQHIGAPAKPLVAKKASMADNNIFFIRQNYLNIFFTCLPFFTIMQPLDESATLRPARSKVSAFLLSSLLISLIPVAAGNATTHSPER